MVTIVPPVPHLQLRPIVQQELIVQPQAVLLNLIVHYPAHKAQAHPDTAGPAQHATTAVHLKQHLVRQSVLEQRNVVLTKETEQKE